MISLVSGDLYDINEIYWKVLNLIEVKCSIGTREDLGFPTTIALEKKLKFMEFYKTVQDHR